MLRIWAENPVFHSIFSAGQRSEAWRSMELTFSSGESQ
jgi:hypothetical protein